MSQVDLTQYNINELIIETTTPQKEGKIEIGAQRAIHTDVSYTQEQISSIAGIETKAQVVATLGGVTIVDGTATMTSILDELQMSANLIIDRDTLSTCLLYTSATLHEISEQNAQFPGVKIITSPTRY